MGSFSAPWEHSLYSTKLRNMGGLAAMGLQIRQIKKKNNLGKKLEEMRAKRFQQQQ